MADTQVGDYGHDLVITVTESGAVKDLSSFTTSRTIRVRKPDKTETVLTASAAFVTDGTDGQVSYTWQNGDLDQAGRWKAQLVAVSGSSQFSSTWAEFSVGRNI